MSHAIPLWMSIWLLALTLVAATTDTRTGLIPNWLTLPSLALALLVHGVLDGPGALGASLAGTLVCGLVPLLLFGLRAIGGGDVKLFAALGGLTGLELGMELQLLSYAWCVLYALCLLAYRGALLATFARSAALLGALLLPRAARRPASIEAMTSVRLGVSILLASACVVVRAALGA